MSMIINIFKYIFYNYCKNNYYYLLMVQFINNFQNIKKFKTKKIKQKIFIDINIINYFIKYLNQPIIPFLFINYKIDS